jgi:hypothetical protein
MKNLLFLFLTFLIVLPSQAQSDSENYKHSLGLSAGLSTGLGFSYRYWPKRIGVQVTGIPIFSSNRFFSSSGLSVLAKIRDLNNIRLFGYLGTNLFYSRSKSVWTGNINESYNFFSALGAGLRFNFLESFNLNIQTGYGVFYQPNSNSYQTAPSGEIGFYYHF